jgi:4-aminobutyrate aminotransferase-like enzyme
LGKEPRQSRGSRFWDVDGVCRIDCINNFTSLIHGHAHPAIVQAAQAQLALGTAFGLPTESDVVLAELLCDRVRSVEQIRFCNSASEAVMMAIKASGQHGEARAGEARRCARRSRRLDRAAHGHGRQPLNRLPARHRTE